MLLPGLLYGCAGGMVPFPSIPSKGKNTASNDNDSGAMVTCVNNVNIKGGSGSHGGRPPSDECPVRQAVCAVRTAQAARCGWTSAGFQAVATETPSLCLLFYGCCVTYTELCLDQFRFVFQRFCRHISGKAAISVRVDRQLSVDAGP